MVQKNNWLAWLIGKDDTRQPVIVIEETLKRYRIKADKKKIRLSKRFLNIDDAPALVPKTAITPRCSFCKGSGTSTAVDGIIGGQLINPRPATCIVCDGSGNEPSDNDS